MAEEGLLEPLVIIEPGDIMMSDQSGSAAFDHSCDGKPDVKEEGDKSEDNRAAAACPKDRKQQSEAREEEWDENTAEEGENTDVGQSRCGAQQVGEMHGKVNKSPEEDKKVDRDQLPADTGCLTSPEQQAEGTESPQEDAKQAHRLTPDFPEALYELLCTLQEGRRLNDQRCSFRLESRVRRRCHSEPNAVKPANRVIFSSVTSLQREEFFELVATAQARRLDDQRAQFQKSPLQKSKARSIRGSIKQLSFVRKPAAEPPPAPAPKDDLYNMILTTQAQGRLEDQRSRAPGPMDDEDFFSLLLRVQGGRMEEQRTELPCILQT